MKNLFRWKGLAAFVAVCLAIVLFWWLLADLLVKKGLEKSAAAAIGAEVNIAKVNLSLSPLGISIQGIQVTDPDNPAFNLAAVDRMEMVIEPVPLLHRKLIIDKMQLVGLRLGTRRSRPGKLVKKKKNPQPQKASAEQKKEMKNKPEPLPSELCLPSQLPALSLPDAAAILKREKLVSVEMARKLEADLEKARQQWNTRLEQLPDRRKLESYRRKAQELKSGSGSLAGLLGSATKAQQLVAAIKKDLDLLKQAQDRLKSQSENFRKQAAELAKAPGRDLARLEKKYSLSGKGLSNLSRLLFGRQLCHWWQTGARWYGRIRLYLDRLPAGSGKVTETEPLRAKGLDIRFAEKKPLPDFWLRKAKIDLVLAGGHIGGDLSNLSDTPVLVDRPTVLRLLGRNLEKLGSLSLLASFDFTKPPAARHRVSARLAALKIENLALEGLEKLPLEIKSGLANMDLDLVSSGRRLDVKLHGRLAQLTIKAATSNSGLLEEIARVLEGVHSFNFQALVNRHGTEIASRFSSDIDKGLEKAVSGVLKRKSARLTRDLEKEISARLAGPLASIRQKSARLAPIEKEIKKRLNLGNTLVKGLKLPF